MYHVGYIGRFCGLFMVLRGLAVLGVIVLAVLLIVYLVRAAKKDHPQAGKGTESPAAPTPNATSPAAPTPNARALEILSERYAKGEINDEEYKQKKENLTKE